MPELEFEFRLLQPNDDRSQFCCGNIELDRFFQRYAGQNQFRHYIGSNYILHCHQIIAGFVTISAGVICAENLTDNLKKSLPDYPLPVLRIARLAIDKKFQKMGLGKKLLALSFKLALTMKSDYGCIGIVVDAKAESIEFYKKLGFISLQLLSGELGDRPKPEALFLSIKAIEKSSM
jgi:ribosomal protein S18 acetylase RimI-like enzyme